MPLTCQSREDVPVPVEPRICGDDECGGARGLEGGESAWVGIRPACLDKDRRDIQLACRGQDTTLAVPIGLGRRVKQNGECIGDGESGGSAPVETFAPKLISVDNFGIRSVEMHRRWREQDSRGLGTVRLVRVRTVPARINPQSIAVPGAPTPMEPIAIGPEPPYPVAIPQDNSPTPRARRARRKLRRMFEAAKRATKAERVSAEITSITC